MLAFEPIEACRFVILIFCAKHHELFSVVGLIVKLLSKQTSKGPFEMFHVFDIFLGPHIAW